jgi:hypothetical protein
MILDECTSSRLGKSSDCVGYDYEIDVVGRGFDG